MSVIHYLPGEDVTLSSADVIVNTVNCRGVMGAGVAKAFLQRFGRQALLPYFEACASRSLQPGDCPIYKMPDGRLWAAFASKDDWLNDSRIDWIERGLDELALNARVAGASSIALPPPGCGHGGLVWRDVQPLAVRALKDFERIDFHAPDPEPRQEPQPAPGNRKVWMVESEHPRVAGRAISLHNSRDGADRRAATLTSLIPEIKTTVIEVGWQPNVEALLKHYGDAIADSERADSKGADCDQESLA